ncbi:MAG: succinyldiaminopimelate transaminase [Burkholderiales bacterium]|nr:succinyldiaminopimelate transaminase [Burkholderiales bacterium]
MNPRLELLQSYPFQRLTALLAGHQPPASVKPVNLHIGEPKHPTPAFIRDTLVANLDGLSRYPLTLGSDALRLAIAHWIARRYAIPQPDPATQVLPVNGSREALFAFAQSVIDSSRPSPTVICPNPFYQIYEGAALLAGAQLEFINTLSADNFAFDLGQLPETVWRRAQLMYVCSPGNPTGKVLTLEDWRRLFEYADRYQCVIAADECYSEIYFDETKPPLGALAAAAQLGRADFRNLVVFSSLSKRSNVPGMRSGFVAGDAAIIKKFYLYRSYHGGAMSPPLQAASVAAWQDEKHVVANRALYREKFKAVIDILRPELPAEWPDAAFYLWLKTPIDDLEFTRRLHETEGISVLPGSYLAREARGINPGAHRIRIALVATVAECVEAAHRLRRFAASL